MSDPRMENLLTELLMCIQKHGPDSEQVRELVRQNNYKDFKGLAATCIFMVTQMTPEEVKELIDAC